jgi:hypothetical protein
MLSKSKPVFMDDNADILQSFQKVENCIKALLIQAQFSVGGGRASAVH